MPGAASVVEVTGASANPAVPQSVPRPRGNPGRGPEPGIGYNPVDDGVKEPVRMTQSQSSPAGSANPGNHVGQRDHAGKPGAAAAGSRGGGRPPFRADHVGSQLRPPELLRARDDFAAGRIGADDLRAIEDAAIREVVRMQQDV